MPYDKRLLICFTVICFTLLFAHIATLYAQVQVQNQAQNITIRNVDFIGIPKARNIEIKNVDFTGCVFPCGRSPSRTWILKPYQRRERSI